MTFEQASNAMEFRSVYRRQKRTQAQLTLEYMARYGSITQQEAIEAFDCYRLAARIADLRRAGFAIITGKAKGPWAEYRLKTEEEKHEQEQTIQN